MTTTEFKRKLSAIFMADVVGYSRLMGQDEVATLKTLYTYKNVMDELIHQHRGRVVDAPGDAVLAEFCSVVDAVQCAVAVQKELQARNTELPEDRRMEFRIGINIGDVIEEGDKIYGDGVNIAARLEAVADPGGICISKTAFDHIETKLPLGYEFLGEQSVKNIAKPVGAYRVVMEPRVTVQGTLEKEKVSLVSSSKIIYAAAIIVVITAIVILARNLTIIQKETREVSISDSILKELIFNKNLSDWKVSTTTPLEPLYPKLESEYFGRKGVVILGSCSYSSRNLRLGGPTMSSLSRQVSVPAGSKKIELEMAKCKGGGQYSGYSDGFLGLFINGQCIQKWYLRHNLNQDVEWKTETVNFGSFAGKLVEIELRGMPGGTGKNCKTCSGTCDNEAVAVDRIVILGNPR